MGSELSQAKDSPLREVLERDEDTPRMRHYAVPPSYTVGFCGTPRNNKPLLEGGVADCVVCAAMWQAYLARPKDAA